MINKELIIRSLSSDISNNDRKKLQQWLDAGPDNQQEYKRLKLIWERSEQVLADPSDEVEAAWQKFRRNIQALNRSKRQRRLAWYGVAASMLVMVGLAATLYWLLPEKQASQPVEVADTGLPYILTPNGDKLVLGEGQTEIRYDSLPALKQKSGGKDLNNNPTLLELVVPRSRRMNLVLADGSRVWLNSESRLRYPEFFMGDTRQVELEGEAFFSVQRKTDKPFMVNTQDIAIEVLGTTFNVTAYPGDRQASATLVEGSVRFRGVNSQGSWVLEPDQRAVYDCDTRTVAVGATDTELYTSWILGYLKFESESLEHVIQKLVRNYGIPMEIRGAGLKEYKFSGKLDLKETANQVLDIIRLAAPLDYVENNGTILILDTKQ